MSAQNLCEALKANASRHADQDAIRMIDRSLSFSAWDTQSDAVAAYLVNEGVQRGDRIALYCPNSDAFAVIYTGILKAGAVVVPLNLLANPKELAFICQDADVRGIFYHPALSDPAKALFALVPAWDIQVLIADEGGAVNLSQVMSTATSGLSLVDLGPQELAAILYTSGTTGQPKGAMLSHGNLLANTRSVFQALELRPGKDVLLVVLPMFHAFAATVGMLTPLLYGLTIAPVPRFEPQLVTDVAAATGSTIFLGVPSMFNLLSRLPEAQIARWSSVRFAVAGGAAMPVALLNRVEKLFGFPVLEGDGPTECSPVTCVNPLHGVRKPGSVGLEVADVSISVRDDDGQALPANEIGELCVRGPNVMQGYWKLPEETAAVFFDDWLRTGDLGYKDEDDYVYIVDRKKDMVIVNGMNVYPRMLEEVLYQHPAVLEAAVVGEPHGSHGEIPVAYLVVREDAATEAADLREHCRTSLAQYQLPRKFFFLQALPKNAAGKVLKRELRKSGELERGIDSREAGAS